MFGTEGHRYKRVVWGGPGVGVGERIRTSAGNWKKPLEWNRKQAKKVREWEASGRQGPRPSHFVFGGSLCDVFDNAWDPQWRRDLFDLIRATPHLTWLLLTKRPGNIVKLFDETLGPQPGKGGAAMLEAARSSVWPSNAAIGCTVVTQEEADRDIIRLLAAKARLNPAFAFVSMEPLLGPVDLTRIVVDRLPFDALRGHLRQPITEDLVDIPKLDWVITGGETDQGGPNARPANPQWLRSIRDQCAAAGVPYHHKQNGEWVSVSEVEGPQTAFHEFLDDPDPENNHRTVRRVGKARAGRTLDGVIHDARPEVRHA